MNKLEERAARWLKEQGITEFEFLETRTPDFLLPDGSGYEVKRLVENRISLGTKQLTQLRRLPRAIILVFSDKQPAPVAIIPVDEIGELPCRWKEITISRTTHGMDDITAIDPEVWVYTRATAIRRGKRIAEYIMDWLRFAKEADESFGADAINILRERLQSGEDT